MFVFQDSWVLGQDGGIFFSCRGNDELVGRIFVKGLGQGGRTVGEDWGDGDETKFGHFHRLSQPIFRIAGDSQSILFEELAEFPR